MSQGAQADDVLEVIGAAQQRAAAERGEQAELAGEREALSRAMDVDLEEIADGDEAADQRDQEQPGDAASAASR